MASFNQGAGGQRWPFDQLPLGNNDIREAVYADVFNRPIEIVQLVITSQDNMVGSARAFVFMWDEGDIELGVDPPEMVIPFMAGLDPDVTNLAGFFVSEDGVPGQLWNEPTVAANAVADENVRQMAIPEGICTVGFLGMTPTE
jgi:hypothetical protein